MPQHASSILQTTCPKINHHANSVCLICNLPTTPIWGQTGRHKKSVEPIPARFHEGGPNETSCAVLEMSVKKHSMPQGAGSMHLGDP